MARPFRFALPFLLTALASSRPGSRTSDSSARRRDPRAGPAGSGGGAETAGCRQPGDPWPRSVPRRRDLPSGGKDGSREQRIPARARHRGGAEAAGSRAAAGRCARGAARLHGRRQTGLVVRGYVSKIDKTVQPYGLVIPESYSPALPRKWRLDAWFHGRSETGDRSERSWRSGCRIPGEFTPPDTIVLHLYGRYCNANKFAGEVDLFEALDDVKRRYPIDEDRISVRGFSMGGAACLAFRRRITPACGRRPRPARAFARRPSFSTSSRTVDGQADLVGAEVVASLRRDRLRGQLRAMPGGGLQRRDRRAEAGGRRHGAGTGQGGHPAEARRRVRKRGIAIIPIRLSRSIRSSTGSSPPDATRTRAAVRFTTWTLRVQPDELGGGELRWASTGSAARVDAEINGPAAVKVTTSGVTGFTSPISSLAVVRSTRPARSP